MHGWSAEGDWLFHSLTGNCEEEGRERDNDPSTALSVEFIIGLHLVAAIAIAISSWLNNAGASATSQTRKLSQATICGEAGEEQSREGGDVEAVLGGYHVVQTVDSEPPSRPSTYDGAHMPLTEEMMNGPVAIKRSISKELNGKVAQKAPTARKLDMDLARIICVACVVTEHSGGSNFSKNNVFFALQWVLPFLYVTSGCSYMLSKASMGVYTLRLLAVFIIGTFANWIADVIRGFDMDVGNTIFQMWYVVFLMVAGIALNPTRRSLRWRSEHPTERASWKDVAHMLGWLWIGVVCIVATWAGWYLDHHSASGWLESKAAGLVKYVVVAFANICCFVALVNLGNILGPSPMHGWILLMVLYLNPIVVPFQDVGYSNNIGLYVFGMISQVWPLKGSKQIARVATSYWPIWFIVLVLLSSPNQYGRCDLRPALYTWDRFRFYSIEYALVGLFVTGALRVEDPFNIIPPLARWSLYAYVFHVMWYRLLGIPWGALVSYLSVFVFLGISFVRGELTFNAKEME